MLYVLPLEQMEERYTSQWYRWFKRDCEDLRVPYTYVDGFELGDGTVEVGTVLDAAGTCYWKMTQMAKVCQLFKDRIVKDGDKFFTMDLWHPGLECIPYMAKLYGLEVDVYGFLHAGSYTKEDFAAPMADWAKFFEEGWYTFCQKVFVGSHYHKVRFLKSRASINKDWIVVTGNPITISEMPELNLTPRENIIIFTSRWDDEKRPQDFIEAMKILWLARQDFRVVITTSRPEFRSNRPELLDLVKGTGFPCEVKVGLSKEEYYNELNRAKVFVSTTIEENFGYCLVEAMAMGVMPVVRNGYSHYEVARGRGFYFDSLTECASNCSTALSEGKEASLGLRRSILDHEDSFKRMIGEMADG